MTDLADLPRLRPTTPSGAARRRLERWADGRHGTDRRAAGLAVAAFIAGTLAAALVAPAARAQETAAPAATPARTDGEHIPAPQPITAPKAVIELFTSQGCSSCPPADKLMGEMIETRRDVIVLSLSVDYWDYLGWKDTLAKHGHSLRQKAYAKARGDGKMFTPQAVVNGAAMAIGSDGAAVERAIAKAPRPSVPVAVETREGKLHVTVGKAPAGIVAGEIWLCPVASRMDVEIGRGENEGTHITYHNVVRGWVKLGDWDGAESTYETTLKVPPDFKADQVAVLVQSGSFSEPGAIVGAALTPLK
ncbi:DUF1223 domain-containing protein [Ancylobacter sp. VKM B-3255]|uniref:DUF1223 domain-containing protein n=2 Tax=Ancylobacter radicis TaxID=2836179 RepID=A0ABS5R778_9HYPH|nr:DUF1223 domain-containing protein [Ancylobacter radicis]